MFAGDAGSMTDHTAAAIFSSSAGECVRVTFCVQMLAQRSRVDLAKT
jgi:hypothetical protein